MLQDSATLFSAWVQLCQCYTSSTSTINDIFSRIVNAYSESHRTYHTLKHIEYMLTVVNMFPQELTNPHEVELAVWFHDVVYDPKATDNEELSCHFAAEVLSELELSSSTSDRVAKLILFTMTHQPDTTDSDACVLVDADLAILGASEAEYDGYAKAIRSEYSWVADDDFARGRTNVLRGFLGREKIFHTARLFAILEDKARRNLQREIDGYSQTNQ